MHFASKIYKSVNLNPDFLRQSIDDYQEGDSYRYFLVDDKLVPESLLISLFDHLSDFGFEYGYVWSIRELLGESFWSSLDEFERSVAGACVLIIIENGFAIPVCKEFLIKH